MQAVKIACEQPAERERALGQWDSTEIARQLEYEQVVAHISASTVRRYLVAERLKPWRVHAWLSPQVPRDAAFLAQVRTILDLYTRLLAPDEEVWSCDELTSLQPRSRTHPTTPAAPNRPVRVEHEYRRSGAVNLLALFNTRTGQVIGHLEPRKRQVEVIALFADLEAQTPDSVRVIHLILDNVSTHVGKDLRAWLVAHPRFVLHFPPVHCSWLNQVEQWFSIVRRKRLRVVNFPSLEALAQGIRAFIAEWNRHAHAFQWKQERLDRYLARLERQVYEQEALAA